MNDKLSQWKQAKELCECINHLCYTDKIRHINKCKTSETIKKKARKLVEKYDHDFDLIESNGLETFLLKVKQEDSLIGKNIDGYQLIKILGVGGMSSVYLAKRTDSDIQKFVALKILSPYATAEKHLELFNREQQSLSRLNHNNIVSLHHGGQTEDGTNYLVMEYIQGARDTIQYCKDEKLNYNEKTQLIKSIANAISYAHKKGIIHRDLKSANILIDVNHNVKIVDFGIALFSKNAKSTDSTRVFTIDIASPEQILDQKIDLRTDVFSLGALLLQLLTDEPPTPKVKLNQYNPVDVRNYVQKILKNSNLNMDLKNIVLTAMHIDKSKRYQDMNAFAGDLDRYLLHQPVKVSSDSIFYRFKKLVQRNPLTSSLVAVVLLVSLVAVITVFNSMNHQQTAEDNNIRSMAIIDAIFEQADPFKSGVYSQELVEALENIEQNKQDLIDNDKRFGFQFYEKMAMVYSQNGNYTKALASKIKQIDALQTYAKAGSMSLLVKKIDKLTLLHSIGDYSQVTIFA